MFAVAIEDLEVCLSNSNLPLTKSAIWFELLAQKGETGEKMAGVLCYKYQESFTKAYAYLGKTCAKICFFRLNHIVTILKKQVVKQAIGTAEGKSEIVTIFNKYKDTLDNFINSLDLKSANRPYPIDEGLCNALRSAGNSMGLSKGYCLDKNISNCQSAWRAPETGDFQVHQYHNIALFDPISKKEHYRKDERVGELWKD